ncbi:MAG: molybdopterin-dependent oxidoreductase [Spirochaetota bacterium]|nr:molybdopterin-dependent oxidoreductase [Spirochaetota bacterium]
MKFVNIRFSILLFGLHVIMKIISFRYPLYKKRLKDAPNFTAQIKIRDNSMGRYFTFKDGFTSKKGIHPDPDVIITYYTAEIAVKLLSPPIDYLSTLNAAKEFLMSMEGPDELSSWFIETLGQIMTMGIKYGIDVGNNTKRYVNCTLGGPVFVYVKDGRIIRVTPIEFDRDDAESWTIKARGREFTPPRKATISPFVYASKSLVYSPDRILYPMKRVDFDPKGERNCENRGISGYERISWEEALDIVADEMKRIKREYGQGAILAAPSDHQTFSNIAHYLSTTYRFWNIAGHSRVIQNPTSFEGWYWGAMHHWGYSLRVGMPESYSMVEEALKECEMIVFWSSDPECTSGVYGGGEGTIRRMWAKELGIKMVHIDPYYNHTAALFGGKWLPVRPSSGNALALAIAYVWITEDLYDKDYISKRTTGFDKWKDYILGKDDGIPKTPEWQEKEAGVPPKDVRALAREWASKKTFLSAGGVGNGLGAACRDATGAEWARSMVCLIAMQGLGKPGINMGNLQVGTPIDGSFCFPGYAEGGISGDLQNTGLAFRLINNMPQAVTMNTSNQKIPRLRLPEAILTDEPQSGYMIDPLTIEGQFQKFQYPEPGHARIQMYYRQGSSHIATMTETNRFVKMYRTERLPFVVNQSIWLEGEAKFADIILPACTNFERWDICESGHYLGHSFNILNHRVITMQHKCIEPLGESKPDYEIYYELAKRLGYSAYFSEGMTDLDWCKRYFDATDMPKVTTWKKFLKKGYYVVPAPPEELRPPVSLRWFAEGRKKDTPDMGPLPGDYTDNLLEGLQTQSGKIEFDCSSLKRFDPDDTERPTMTKYVPSWEGHHTKELYDKYPLQLVTPKPRFSIHTNYDGKDSFVNDVKDHRVLVDGYYYWIARINTKDADKRGIKENDLVKVFNDRGAVLCAARITERVSSGAIHACGVSAKYDPVGKPGESPDRGGSMNILTSKRFIAPKTHSAAYNAVLVQIEKWREE